MSAPHFFVERIEGRGRLPLSAEDSLHALRSLRMRPGEPITVADASGRVGRGYLVGGRDGRAIVEVATVEVMTRPQPLVSVAFAAPASEGMRWAVRQLAELGVDEAVVMQAERSVRRWGGGRAERAQDRLRVVAREAAMQARQPFVMAVRAGVSFEEALATGGARVLLWEGATTPLRAVLPEEAQGIRLVVGPEGGFTDQEVAAARASGAAIASLGRSILRTETAAVVAAALVLARYHRLG